LNPGQLQGLRKKMKEKYGDKILHEQQADDKQSVEKWLQLLNQSPALQIPASLEIDYPVYGAGEAMLAWLDQEIEIKSETGDANQAAMHLVRDIHRRIVASEYPVGHLKFLVNGKEKVSFSSSPAPEPGFGAVPAFSAFLLLNARVQTKPGILSQVVVESIREAERKSGISIRTRSVSAFQPGYPTPTHRMA
ncbi:MAG: hypothetical protein Q8926_12000, partial [Bacteroidota bacterium]|nr:hypothetical protein [Bacteroidota bacterium]